MVAEGDEVESEFLLDDAADVNVVSQSFVLQYGLKRIASLTLPAINSFNREKGHCYGAYRLDIRLVDSDGCGKHTSSVFYAMDMPGAPVLLSRPWRRQQSIIVHSATNRWFYGRETHAVRIVEARDFYRLLKREA